MIEYGTSMLIGGCLALGVFGLYFVSLLVQWVWSIIDETPMGKYNWFVHALCIMWGYKLTGNSRDGSGIYTYVKPKGGSSDGEVPCFITVGVLAVLPSLMLAAVQFYTVTLIVCTVLGVIFLARFSRRTFKRLVKHEGNPNAHRR